MYDWTQWLDHVTSPSNCYRIVDNGDGTYTITPCGEVMQQGTPMDQDRFNNLESGIIDAHAAGLLLLNYVRQRGWELDDVFAWFEKVNQVFLGTAALTNTQEFPFNDSLQTVSIGQTLDNTYYEVQVAVTEASGNVGEIEVSDKLTNGFKLAFTGSAASVSVAWVVIPNTTRL